MRLPTPAGLTIICIAFTMAATPTPFAGAASVSVQAPASGVSQADLEEMLGPIALYPDELLANVLAAAIYPGEITAANAYVSRGGDPEKIADQGWEEPVQSIATIPDLVAFLAENIDWITAVGQAYIVQSTDVMKAVQALRAKAMENGALKSGEQMTVVKEGPTIIIQPTNPEIIYVPVYNPRVVYVAPRPGTVIVAGAIGFGVGVMVGSCFHSHYHCHWHGGYVGWGWGHSHYHGGKNKVNIDNSVNIKTGDININSGNKVQGGDRNTANIGREGTRWQPNEKKANTMDIKKPGGADKLNGFKGVAGNTTAQTRVPDRTIANTGRQSPAAATRDIKPANRPATPAARPNIPSTPAPRPANTPAAPKTRETPVLKSPPARTESPRPASPAAKAAPAQSKPGGFSPDRGGGTNLSTGAAKRNAPAPARTGNAGNKRPANRG